MLKKGSKTPNLALNCLNFPFLCKRWVFIQKWILSWFKCFAHYFFKNPCFPYPFFVSQTPLAPFQPLCFNLECYVFQFVEFEFGMSIWCHWFSRLSSSIPFMRSYLNMLINSKNCFLCDTYMWVFVLMFTSIFSHITRLGCVVRKSEWKLSAYLVRNWANSLRHVTTFKTWF